MATRSRFMADTQPAGWSVTHAPARPGCARQAGILQL